MLTDARPKSYQRIGGRKVAVQSRFSVAGSTYGFVLGNHDSRRPLMIDPGLVYSTYLGGSGYDEGVSIEVDASGNAYVTGSTQAPDFPTTTGAFDRTYHDGYQGDAFVTKLSATGSSLVYSTYLGGADTDRGDAIAVDAGGNAYVIG